MHADTNESVASDGGQAEAVAVTGGPTSRVNRTPAANVNREFESSGPLGIALSSVRQVRHIVLLALSHVFGIVLSSRAVQRNSTATVASLICICSPGLKTIFLCAFHV